MWTLLHLLQFCLQLQTSILWDQLEHLIQIRSFALSFLTISCFSSSFADLKPGQSLTHFDIPSAPVFVLYLCADLLQTGHKFSPPWLRTAIFLGLLHFPEWDLWHKEHFYLSPFSSENRHNWLSCGLLLGSLWWVFKKQIEVWPARLVRFPPLPHNFIWEMVSDQGNIFLVIF